MRKLQEGLIPESMEDKWFVYFEDPFLYFHRSWTGTPVYRVELELSEGASVVDAQVSTLDRDGEVSVDFEAALLESLTANLLLGEARPFPRPAGLNESTPGIFQRAVAGTGYPEIAWPRKTTEPAPEGDR